MSMRVWSLLPVVVAACSFDGSGVDPAAGDPDGGMGDPDGGDMPGGPDAAGVGAVLRHDTAADFRAGGPRFDRARVEEWGAIGPEARVVGALLARGIDDRLFDDADEVDWDELHRQTGGGASLMTPSPLPLVGNIPVGVGITRATQWTLWLEGEVFLEAGAHEWHLDVDDDGLVEIAAPDTAAFQRAVAADFNEEGDGTFTARTTGWHPIRIAVSQGGGDSGLALVHRGPGEIDRLPLPPHRLRAVAPALTGLLAQGFDDRRMLDARGVNLMRGAGLLVDFGTSPPRDLGILDPDTFAVRWSGQVRIDVAGRYQLRATSDDGQRVAIDGRRVLDFWSDQRETHDVEIDLDAGWHDLAVDLREATTTARFDLSVVAGPELAGGRFPAERLRPTLVRTAQVGGGLVAANLAIADSGTPASSKMTLDAATDAIATTVDATVTVSHVSLPDLEIAVRAPNGTERVVIPVGGVRGPSVAVSSSAIASPTASPAW
jgi:hypothetical protein